MSIFSYESLKKLLFKLEPETAHSVVSFGLKWGRYCPLVHPFFKKRYFVEEPNLRQNLFGREFKNPIGLAAGFDKNAEYITTTPLMGFGFTEVGTITPKPQPGNPKPRLFRLIEERSIQNAMGFNNRGAEFMLNEFKELKGLDKKLILDCGNGVAGVVIEDIFNGLELNYKGLYCNPDGTFPNHHPDPSVEESLASFKEAKFSSTLGSG